MKTSEIKKQLQKCNLPTNGSRDALIERHRQFTLRVVSVQGHNAYLNPVLDHDNPMPAWKIAQIVISNEEKTKVTILVLSNPVEHETMIVFSTHTPSDEEEYKNNIETHKIFPKRKNALLSLYPSQLFHILTDFHNQLLLIIL